MAFKIVVRQKEDCDEKHDLVDEQMCIPTLPPFVIKALQTTGWATGLADRIIRSEDLRCSGK